MINGQNRESAGPIYLVRTMNGDFGIVWGIFKKLTGMKMIFNYNSVRCEGLCEIWGHDLGDLSELTKHCFHVLFLPAHMPAWHMSPHHLTKALISVQHYWRHNTSENHIIYRVISDTLMAGIVRLWWAWNGTRLPPPQVMAYTTYQSVPRLVWHCEEPLYSSQSRHFTLW